MNLRSVGAAVIALSVPHIVWAQEAPPPASPSAPVASSEPETGSVETGDIVVTARRRDESLSRVPVSVTAFGAEQLANRTITSQADLQTATPGLLIRATNNSNDLNYALRGQSLEAFSGSSPAVLPYFNDVQLTTGGSAALYDLQSVQVLKGPQGTLFGRNTTGGAVLFATARPTSELGGFLTARIGNLNLRQVTGALTIPIVEDKVLLRVAGDVRARGGYVLNLYNGEKLGRDRRQSGRVTLVLKPSDTIENTTVFQYNHAKGTSAPGQLYSLNLPGSIGADGLPLASSVAATYNPATFNALFGPGGWDAFLAAHPGVPNVSYADYLGVDRANGKFVASTEVSGLNRVTDYLLSNTTTIAISDALNLKNIFGYGKSKSYQETDFDGTPFPVAPGTSPTGSCTQQNNGVCTPGDFQRNETVSNELQLSGNTSDRGVNYIFGLYYSRDKKYRASFSYFFDLMPFVSPITSSASGPKTFTDYAAFSQISLDLGVLAGLQGLKLTGGVRYTREVATFEQDEFSQWFPFFGAAPERRVTKKPSWTATLEYQATPNLLLYAANRGSWRSGGFNGSAPPIPVTGDVGGNVFLPETTVDVEAGAKFRGRVGGMPLSANLAVYNQWINDAQRIVYFLFNGGLQAATPNVPKAKITGFEFDTNVQPTEWLQLGANAAYTHARFTDGSVSILGNDFILGPYADTPKWSGSAYVQTQFPLAGLGELVLRGDVYAQSKVYFSNLNATKAPSTVLAGYKVVNARAELRDVAGTKASVAFFAKNLFDKSYYVGGLPEGAAFGSNMAIVGEPRTYGLEVNLKF